ncbi:PAP2 domain containing protein, partial [Asbolus verrucosus]
MHVRHKLLLILALLVYLLEYDFIPSTKFSFICKDPKISHPFKGDTVSLTSLLTGVYFGPILIFGLVEVLQDYSFRKMCIHTIWKYYKECLTGSTLILLLTEVIKASIREPRPHFLYSCKPDSNNVCQAGTLIFEYNCTNHNLSNLYQIDLTRSFPSGHTSISVFIALYCSYIVHTRIPSKGSKFLAKSFLIGLCITWSLLCSVSRITDRRHHWWDVLGGAVIGICGAWYSLNFLS